MAASTTVKAKQLNWIKGTAFGTAPTTLFLGFASSLTDNGSTANTATFFASRVAITFGAPATIATNRTIKNSAIVSMGNTIAAGSISFFEIWDAVSGGNCLWSGVINNTSGVSTPIAFGSGDAIDIGVNSISLFMALGTNSAYSADNLLNWVRGTAYPSVLANIYAAIANVSGVESVSLGRIAIPNSLWSAIVTTGINQQIRNTNIIDWGFASVAFPSANRISLFDAASAGNSLGFSLITQKDIAVSESVLLSANALSVTAS